MSFKVDFFHGAAQFYQVCICTHFGMQSGEQYDEPKKVVSGQTDEAYPELFSLAAMPKQPTVKKPGQLSDVMIKQFLRISLSLSLSLSLSANSYRSFCFGFYTLDLSVCEGDGSSFHYNWASNREKLSSGVCEQHRCRPACAYAQSDQRLCYSLLGKYHMKTCYR